MQNPNPFSADFSEDDFSHLFGSDSDIDESISFVSDEEEDSGLDAFNLRPVDVSEAIANDEFLLWCEELWKRRKYSSW